MKEILINYPIKFLQQELINIRTGFRLEKKKIMEILRTMKSINKLSKEELIDLLIKYNYDISKIPKLETLIKPIKAKKEIPEIKKEEPKKEPIKAKKEIPEIKKEEPIKKFMIKKNKVSTEDFLKMRDDFKFNTYEWSKQAYEVGLTDNEILSYSGFKENDYKILNAFFTPNDIIEDMIDFSFLYENLTNAKYYNNILNILEPTGGIGNIIYYILENINKNNKELLNYIKIDFVEFNPTFIEIAKAKLDKYKDIINYYNIDFFKFETDKKYDFIFGNPPYNMKFNNKTIYDVDFFNKCWELLDFKIIFLMSPTSLKGKTQSHKKFKEIINYTEKELIDYGKLHKYKNNFKKGETPAGITNIETYLYIIDKNE